MKIPFPLKAGFLLLGGSCSMNALAEDSIAPEMPEAYEPFTLKIDVPAPPPGGSRDVFYQLDTSDNAILIGYLRTGLSLGLAPPFITTSIDYPLGLPPGTYTVKLALMSDLADDALDIEDTGFSFMIAETPPTQKAYAFYNTGLLEHFFVTAGDEEAEALLLSPDQWQISDFGFNVWHADDPAPTTAVPVCRFYSEQVNSHFYTGDEAECTLLKEEDQDWEYEGIAFQALVPLNGACPIGTDPVWRLYNDRAALQDSNHRFIASSETYHAMIAKGWLGEGVAFCSPPASADN